ncbi:MAG: hypothetical protein Q4C83_01485 [Candidatus Saccharibacteria bacterium]|nr:hypothetical protein [Candidatus Saccharibacteria bacterium]
MQLNRLKLILVTSGVVIVTGAIVVACLMMINPSLSDEISFTGAGHGSGCDKIIAETSSYDSAWDATYSGRVLCQNGNIYEFSKQQHDGFYVDTEFEALQQAILSKSYKIGEADKDDLAKIKEYIPTIDNTRYVADTEADKQAAKDVGVSRTVVWNYSSSRRLSLISVGSSNGKNTSPKAEELTQLIDKVLDMKAGIEAEPQTETQATAQ